MTGCPPLLTAYAFHSVRTAAVKKDTRNYVQIKSLTAKKSSNAKDLKNLKLTLVTSFKEFSCNSLMFSTKNGATDKVDICKNISVMRRCTGKRLSLYNGYVM